jgi:hypothetical protein
VTTLGPKGPSFRPRGVLLPASGRESGSIHRPSPEVLRLADDESKDAGQTGKGQELHGERCGTEASPKYRRKRRERPLMSLLCSYR